MKKLLLIDGSNLMFRAYYATAYSGRLMKNSKGEYTNAVYGLVNMLNVLKKENFTHALVAFDKGKATFRHQAYAEYKAGRKPMPDEFRSQLETIKITPEKLGFKVYETEELEADDIIGSLATTYYDAFDEIEIISNDKDLFQLLNHKVTIRQSKKGLEPDKSYTKETLQEEMGIAPEQITDLKGLMGDSSDNLPGVPGVGEKTALKLLKEYESIDTLLRNVNDLKGKLKERIETYGKDAVKWRDLATLKCDASFDFDLDDLAFTGPDDDTLKQFYETQEFHSLIKRMETHTNAHTLNNVTIIEDPEILKTFNDQSVYMTLEVFGENYHISQPLGVGIKTKSAAYFLSEEHFSSDSFKTFLANESVEKNVFDAKKMHVVFNRYGAKLNRVVFDLLIGAYVLNPSYTQDEFKVIVSHFDYDDVDYDETIYGKGKKASIPEVKQVATHALKKANALANIKEQILNAIEKNNQTALFYDVEMPLIDVLAKMEMRGTRIDIDALNTFEKTLDDEIKKTETRIFEHADQTFNVGSPKQLGEILFEKLELPVYKKSKTGYSTNIDVLKKLQGQHPIIDDIMEHRQLTKLKNAYVTSLKESVHDDGKIHTIYKQALTQTGRLSSIEPNLQTIPIRTQRGRAIRKVFIPDGEHVLLAADYSQIELRVLAHMAHEDALIKAFKNGDDIHAITAKEVLGTTQINDNERRMAKAVNFGIIYGQSAWGLSEELGISQQDAKSFIERYYERFPGIQKFMDDVVARAKKDGYVTTLYNRRRYIPELFSKIHAQREFGKRTAMNAPLQGSAADIIKIAMVEIERAMEEKNFKSEMILQIHDELVFNVVKGEQASLEALVKTTMETCVDLLVPLDVDPATGETLDDAK